MKKVLFIFAVFCLVFIGGVNAGRDEVKPGIGVELVKIGEKKDVVDARFGPPEEGSKVNWSIYRKQIGIDILYDHRNLVYEIRFNGGTPYKLEKGVRIGASMKSVFKRYGDPIETFNYPANLPMVLNKILYHTVSTEGINAWKICYNKEGVLFWFDKNKKVSQFVIFKPGVREPRVDRIICPCCGNTIIMIGGKVVGYVEKD